jgi:hypothetical protein
MPKYPLSEDIASYEPLIKDRISVILSIDDDLESDYSTESESSENDEDHEVDDHRTQRKVKRTQAKSVINRGYW